MKNKIKFKVGDYCVYRTHGVALIKDIQTIDLFGHKMNCYVLYFEKANLTMNVPEDQVESGFIRSITSPSEFDEVFLILKDDIKNKKEIWSKKVKDYDEKLNSGNICLLAEVVKDLTKVSACSERSFSENVLYEEALYRLSSEYSISKNISFDDAKNTILSITEKKIIFA